MGIKISVGFLSSPDGPHGYPGFDDGGIRISVDGHVLTRYETPFEGFAKYDAEGNPLEHDSGEYVGQFLDINLKQLKNAILRFQDNDFERYEELPAKMEEEPGDSAVVLSFCDGEHVRIAFQSASGCYGSDYPTEVAVGYAIDPDEMCRELADCYRECVTFFENAFGEYDDMDEEFDEVHDWTDRHIEELLVATTDD